MIWLTSFFNLVHIPKKICQINIIIYVYLNNIKLYDDVIYLTILAKYFLQYDLGFSIPRRSSAYPLVSIQLTPCDLQVDGHKLLPLCTDWDCYFSF